MTRSVMKDKARIAKSLRGELEVRTGDSEAIMWWFAAGRRRRPVVQAVGQTDTVLGR